MRGISVGLLIGMLLAISPAHASSALTAPELRAQFTQCGFEIGNPSAPPANQYVVIRDAGASLIRDADYRIVMAIVYKDAAAANQAHEQAHRAAEARLNAYWSFSDDNGPQLLVGYGGSVWRANIALVETSYRTFAGLYSYSSDGQTDTVSIARPELTELGFVTTSTEYGVDRDVVACLDEAGLTATSAVGAPVAIFVRGQPW
jgi:hypothetical protein